jgi:hypothetical protein
MVTFDDIQRLGVPDGRISSGRNNLHVTGVVQHNDTV